MDTFQSGSGQVLRNSSHTICCTLQLANVTALKLLVVIFAEFLGRPMGNHPCQDKGGKCTSVKPHTALNSSENFGRGMRSIIDRLMSRYPQKFSLAASPWSRQHHVIPPLTLQISIGLAYPMGPWFRKCPHHTIVLSGFASSPKRGGNVLHDLVGLHYY